MAEKFPNSGALFKGNAEKKRENPKWPDYEGHAEIDGKDYWISAWIKESRTGVKFMSLAFKPKDAPALTTPPSARHDIGVVDKPDDDVPFR